MIKEFLKRGLYHAPQNTPSTSQTFIIINGCTYVAAMLLITVFIIMWMMGWKKGIKASMWTLTIYAALIILGGLF